MTSLAPVINSLLSKNTRSLPAVLSFLRTFSAEEGIDGKIVYLLVPETTASAASLPEEIAEELEKLTDSSFRVQIITVASSESSTSPIPPAPPPNSFISPFTMADVFAALEKILEDRREISGIFHLWADAPFMNLHANRAVLDLHRRYLSEYIFAEGYPAGITGSILVREIIPALKKDGENISLRRNGIFETVRVNINAYDIETAVSPRDLRMLRLELFTDLQRNIRICENLPLKQEMKTDELCRTIEQNKMLYRSLPAFFALQLSGKYAQNCSYQVLPDLPDTNEFLSPDNFTLILEKITKFVEDPIISLSLWGELSLHPHLPQILEIARSFSSAARSPRPRAAPPRAATRFLIETSGIGWKAEACEELGKFPPGSLDLILCLDSIDPALYAQLRGSGYEEAMKFAEWARATFPGHFYAQALRMLENEDHLIQFSQHWKKEGVRFIIQKFNNFSNYLTQKRVADLSPLRRHECWHVKRDMVVDLSGQVFACPSHSINQQDNLTYGNLFTDDIRKIWARGEKLMNSHVKNALPEICQTCDEWYTYNF